MNETATSYNTAYTAHFVRPNFGYAKTSYMLKGRGLLLTFDKSIGEKTNFLPASADNRVLEVNYQNILPIIDFNLL